MGVTTIEWTATPRPDGTLAPGFTANLWWGCAEVHAGCDHCYARVFARAKGKATAWQGMRFAVGSVWENLRKWQAAAAAAGEFHRVFCGSMMDIFEKPLPAYDWHGSPLGITTGELRDRYFYEVIPATPNLLHLLLTKRPGNALKMVPPGWLKRWPENVMVGASVVDQPTADTLIPQLLKVPGPVFLSVEPLLAEMDLRHVAPVNGYGRSWTDSLTGKRYSVSPGGTHISEGPRIAWAIVGGESGDKARTCELDWIRSVVEQCRAARVPAFVKQLGSRASDARNGIAGASLKVPACAAGLVSCRLRDPKGGDIAEFPESLRVRQFPEVPAPVVAR